MSRFDIGCRARIRSVALPFGDAQGRQDDRRGSGIDRDRLEIAALILPAEGAGPQNDNNTKGHDLGGGVRRANL